MTWLDALRTATLEFVDQPVEWGRYDCCQFVARYWELMTGKDLAAQFDYESEMGAGRVLAKHGGLSGLFRHLLGEPGEVVPGAVVLASVSDEGDKVAAGVYAGYCVFLMGDDGLIRVTPERVLEAWPLV